MTSTLNQMLIDTEPTAQPAMNTRVVPGYPDSPQPIPDWLRNIPEHRLAPGDAWPDASHGYDWFSGREPAVRDLMQRRQRAMENYPGYPAFREPGQ